MRVGEVLDSPVKFVTPLVYAAILLLTAFPILQVSLAVVYVSWLPGIFFYLMPVALLSAALGISSWGLLLLEKLQRPRIFDHLRRCAVLYLGLAFFGFLFLNAVYEGTTGSGPSVLILALLCIVNAILADAIVLLLKRWRSSSVQSGGLS